MNEFHGNWDSHEKKMADTSESDLLELEENHAARLIKEREDFDKKLPNSFRPST